MVKWWCRKSGCARCLQYGGRRGGIACECVESEGSLGADRSAHGKARESHAPSTAVQWSQEELLRNVTAIRDATAQAWAATASLRRARASGRLLEYSRAFYLNFSTASGNTLRDICLPVTATEDDSSEKQHTSLCGCSCWLFSFASFGKWYFCFRPTGAMQTSDFLPLSCQHLSRV